MSSKDDGCKDEKSAEEKAKEEKCKNLPPSVTQKKTIPKPVMRNMHLTKSLNNVYKAIAFSGVCTILFYIFWVKKRRDTYADFYRTYDAQAAFERMQSKGIFNCAPLAKK